MAVARGLYYKKQGNLFLFKFLHENPCRCRNIIICCKQKNVSKIYRKSNFYDFMRIACAKKLLAFKSHLMDWRQVLILQKWNYYSNLFKFRYLLHSLYICYFTTEIDNYFNVDSPSWFHAEFYSRKSSFLVCKFSFWRFFVMWCNGT